MMRSHHGGVTTAPGADHVLTVNFVASAMLCIHSGCLFKLLSSNRLLALLSATYKPNGPSLTGPLRTIPHGRTDPVWVHDHCPLLVQVIHVRVVRACNWQLPVQGNVETRRNFCRNNVICAYSSFSGLTFSGPLLSQAMQLIRRSAGRNS